MNRDGSEIGAPAGTCPATARELWSHLFETLFSSDQRESAALAPLRVILRDGCLSRRILKALDGDVSRSAIAAVYGRLCDRLAAGEMLR